MDINDFGAVVTVLGFVVFLGIVYWAYRARSRPGFDEAAQLPFADDAVPGDATGDTRKR